MTDIEVSQPIMDDVWTEGCLVHFESGPAEIMGNEYCGVPNTAIISERVWLHEFIEMFLWHKPHMRNSIGPDKEGNRNYIAHIIATICHGCFVDNTLITGDEAWERYYK